MIIKYLKKTKEIKKRQLIQSQSSTHTNFRKNLTNPFVYRLLDHLCYRLLNLPGQVFSKSRMKLSNCRAFWRTELSRESVLHWMCVQVCVCERNWDGNSNTSPPPSSPHSSSQPTLRKSRAGEIQAGSTTLPYGQMTKWIKSCTTIFLPYFHRKSFAYSWSRVVSDWSFCFRLEFTSWMDICGSHFPKHLLIIFSHIPPRLQEEVIQECPSASSK